MRRGGRPKEQKKSAADWVPKDPSIALTEQLRAFLQHLEVRHFSQATIQNRRRQLCRFLDWCALRDVHDARDIEKPLLLQYQRWLFHQKRKDGTPIAASTQAARISSLKQFFSWLTKNDIIGANPAADLDMPKVVRALPRDVLSADEAEAIMLLPDVTTVVGIRDRAMLELLYATGIRRKEVTQLTVFDVQLGRGCLFIEKGKGGRSRYVPAGERALGWLQKYLDEARPELALDPTVDALFLTTMGERITPGWLGDVVRGYVVDSGCDKAGACHLFRHTMATLMLENGADIRFIQAMLGHAELSTTQIYTRVAIDKLRQVHAQTHPALKR